MPTLKDFLNYPITRVWQNAAGQLVLKFKFRVAALRQARNRTSIYLLLFLHIFNRNRSAVIQDIRFKHFFTYSDT